MEAPNCIISYFNRCIYSGLGEIAMSLATFPIKKRHGMEKIARMAQELELTEFELNYLMDEIKIRQSKERFNQRPLKFAEVPL
ncbi:hypothetical protein Xbed_03473 [Xenorhabdus beddingii]|uniref:Uncharacterized protein n=1 Tax=Xenorhabdus beddingii TaxID=40578 RepID=A0A1Y2SE44_9GAMM|nr:hypothetical protein [Xenorhabdus beddingii]OTA16546.1 hypothetical protein Xbed_03473 [Xenorhabdus beddingii]